MKLYLSSYRIGEKTDILKEWIKDNGSRICIIANAKDQYPDGERKEKGTLNDISQLEGVGFEVARLDLRDYFGKEEDLQKSLRDCKAVYVVGGNTFVLRRAMKLSGFDTFLKEQEKNNDFLYAGYSAGICVLSKDMHGIAIMDEPLIDPYNYGNVIYKGIGFIDYTPIPHYQSDHAETEAADKAMKFCQKNGIAYKTLRDGEVIVKDMQTKKEQLFTI